MKDEYLIALYEVSKLLNVKSILSLLCTSKRINEYLKERFTQWDYKEICNENEVLAMITRFSNLIALNINIEVTSLKRKREKKRFLYTLTPYTNWSLVLDLKLDTVYGLFPHICNSNSNIRLTNLVVDKLRLISIDTDINQDHIDRFVKKGRTKDEKPLYFSLTTNDLSTYSYLPFEIINLFTSHDQIEMIPTMIHHKTTELKIHINDIHVCDSFTRDFRFLIPISSQDLSLIRSFLQTSEQSLISDLNGKDEFKSGIRDEIRDKLNRSDEIERRKGLKKIKTNIPIWNSKLNKSHFSYVLSSFLEAYPDLSIIELYGVGFKEIIDDVYPDSENLIICNTLKTLGFNRISVSFSKLKIEKV
jgi:hypothetical protein